MKKEINSKSKRKWVAGGLAAFASIALLTTGFATWIVGVTQTSQEGSVTVNVDTAENRSITLDANLNDDKIKLAEPANNTGKFFKVEHATDFQPNMSIAFDKLTVNFGSSLDEAKKPAGIRFSIKAAAGGKVDNKVANSVDAIKFTEERGLDSVTEANLTYFGIYDDGKSETNGGYVDSIDVALTNETYFEKTSAPTAATTTYKLKDSTPYSITFTWGSFFKYQAPTAFYDAMYEEKYINNSVWTSETIGEKTDAALAEMNKMHELDNKQFVIVAQLINLNSALIEG